MSTLTESIKNELRSHGADLVGIGDLREIPPEQRQDLPIGISVAVKYPKEVIKGIVTLPTKEYHDQYHLLNKKLDMLVTLGAELLRKEGFQAVAKTLDTVVMSETDYTTLLPHKTVATRAGLGWIGKSALLVTKEFGSMIRISSILTDAPLKTATPINESNCGNCMICTNACPGGAILGENWSVDRYRDAFFNAKLCRKKARERSMQGFGKDATICGKCIVVCPYTQKYLGV